MNDSAEDSVLAIEVRSGIIADKELGAVGVRTSIGHRKDTLVRVRIPDLLVLESIPID